MSLVGFTHIADKALPVITGSHANFVMLFKYADFNVGTVLDSIDDGGGNLRFSDDDGVTQLPCEVVQFDKIGGNIQVWVLVPNAFTGKVVQIWGGNSGATHPPVTDAFGRNAVWSDYEAVNHGRDLTNSTGKGDFVVDGNMPTANPIVNGGGLAYDGSSFLVHTLASTITHPAVFTMQQIAKATSATGVESDNYHAGVSLAQPINPGGRDFSLRNRQSATPTYWLESVEPNGRLTELNKLPILATVESIWGSFSTNSTTKALSTYSDSLSGYSTNTSSINTTDYTLDSFAIGGRYDASPQSYSGTVGETRLLLSVILSEDFIETEYSNQSAVGSWGVTTSVSGGTGASGDIDFTITKPVFNLLGAATLPQPLADIDFTISKPLFSVEGGASLPQPVGDVDFTVAKPIFSVDGSASLPNPQATISFDIAKPVFNVTGSATSPNPVANIDFTINKPVFDVSGSASLPQPNANISFDVSKPEFSLTGGASVPYPQAIIAFDISKPVFNVNGSVTLPQPSGSVSFEISKPVFTVTGSVSGFNVPIGSTIKLVAGSNVIKLPYTSNTIKL